MHVTAEFMLAADRPRTVGGIRPKSACPGPFRRARNGHGLADRIGTLQEGKLADLLVFDGDPLEDITALQGTARMHVVMTGGTVAIDRAGS